MVSAALAGRDRQLRVTHQSSPSSTCGRIGGSPVHQARFCRASFSATFARMTLIPAALNISSSSGCASSSVTRVEMRSRPATIIEDLRRSLLLSANDDDVLPCAQQFCLRLNDERIGFHDAEAIDAVAGL